MRRLVRLLEACLQRGDFLAEPGDRLLHRLVLFDGGDVGTRGRGESAARQCTDHRAERGRERDRSGRNTKRGFATGAASVMGSTVGVAAAIGSIAAATP